MPRAIVFAALLLAGSEAAAEPATLTNAETGVTFQVRRRIGGEPHVLVGTGVRRAAGLVKVYGAGMYVGTAGAARAWRAYLSGRFAEAGLLAAPGRPDFDRLRASPQLRHFMVYGHFPRAFDMAFVRDVSAAEARDAFTKGLRIGRVDRDAVGEPYDRLVAALGRPIKRGQHVLIRSRGTTIWVTWGGGDETRIDGSRALVIGLWRVYFGEPCLQRPLRQGLLSHVEHVHALATSG